MERIFYNARLHALDGVLPQTATRSGLSSSSISGEARPFLRLSNSFSVTPARPARDLTSGSRASESRSRMHQQSVMLP